MPSAAAITPAELLALAPDVVLTTGSAGLVPLLQRPRTVPIVFTIVPDPVGAGFVDQPGAARRQCHRVQPVRIRLEREMAGAAQGDRAGRHARGRAAGAAVSRPRSPSLRAFQAVAPLARAWRSVPLGLRDADRDRAGGRRFRARLDRRSDRDAGPLAAVHRELIVAVTARHKLPAVYSDRSLGRGSAG